MIECKKGSAERQLDVLWTSGTLTGLSDAQLLCRFTDAQGATAESAFVELVDRHGPMVRGVCRQILRHPHDADDAFQATFLVLVRKARSIQVRESLGLREGGFGLMMSRGLVDELTFNEKGNEVRIVKKFAPTDHLRRENAAAN